MDSNCRCRTSANRTCVNIHIFAYWTITLLIAILLQNSQAQSYNGQSAALRPPYEWGTIDIDDNLGDGSGFDDSEDSRGSPGGSLGNPGGSFGSPGGSRGSPGDSLGNPDSSQRRPGGWRNSWSSDWGNKQGVWDDWKQTDAGEGSGLGRLPEVDVDRERDKDIIIDENESPPTSSVPPISKGESTRPPTHGSPPVDSEESLDKKDSLPIYVEPTEDTEEGSGEPALTDCQQARQRQQQFPSITGGFIPSCTADGKYSPVQCHSTLAHCWCVDERGIETFGSRVRYPQRPDCSGSTTTLSTTQFFDFGRERSETPRKPPTHYWPELPTTRDDVIVIDQRTSTLKSTTSEYIPRTSDPYKVPGFSTGDKEVEGGYSEEAYDPSKSRPIERQRASIFGIFSDPLVLAGLIGGSVLALLCIILLIMFMVYRMRKKDEGSYALGEPKRTYDIKYTRTNDQEFFA